MNILCIDYGTKRIGVAVATSPLAEPLGIIANAKNPRLTDIVTEAALGQIVKLVNEYAIKKILVGVSSGAMAEKTLEFISKLRAHTEVPIEEVDETLTSVEASGKMPPKERKWGMDKDHLAAAIMLQDYLDLH